jgi:SAM-dependent methyltransferase
MSLLSRFKNRFRPEGFKLLEEPFGIGDTERCIEIPWAFSCYQGDKKVLDVGYANAEKRYLNGLFSLHIPQLYGLDKIDKEIDGIKSVIGDIRNTDFPDECFDLLFCISTIEHVGRDNSKYFPDNYPVDDQGDFKAMKEMNRITRKEGRIVLTVPYGKFHDYGWFIQYDKLRLDRLIGGYKFKIVRRDFFHYDNGWSSCRQDELKDTLYNDNNAPAAAGLACILLKK